MTTRASVTLNKKECILLLKGESVDIAIKNQDLERRKNLRVFLSLPITVYNDILNDTTQGEILDISNGGQRCILDEALPRAIKQLKTTFEKDGILLESQCNIVWRNDEKCEYGLSFLQKLPQTLKMVKEIQKQFGIENPSSTESYSTRRDKTRYRINTKIEISLHLNGKTKTLDTKILDISQTGFSAELKEPLKEKEIEVSVYLPYPHDTINSTCKIVWEKTENSNYIYGLEFVDIKEDAILLKEYLSKNSILEKEIKDKREKDRRFNLPAKSSVNLRKKDRRQFYFKVTENQTTSEIKQESSPEKVIFGQLPSNVPVKEFNLLIGGKLLRTSKEEYFPYTSKLITDFEGTRRTIAQIKSGNIPENCNEYIYAKYSVGNSQTNLEAINAAHEASKIFQSFPLAKRHKIMLDIYELMVEKKKELIDLMVIEGHPVKLAEWEYSGMLACFDPKTLDFYKQEMTRELKNLPIESIYLTRKPDGIVCVSPPKNAPCSIALIASLSLLSANTLIIKSPLRAPIACSYLWQNIIHKVIKLNGAPDGTINVVNGHSETILNEWLKSSKVNDIFFFGNSKIGVEIGSKIYSSGKKPILELSGNDFMLVWEDAPLDDAIEALLEGFLGSMQICMAPKKALIHPKIYDKFLNKFTKIVQDKVKPGLPEDINTYLTPITKIKEFQTTLEDSINKGARLVCGGNQINYKGIKDPSGYFVEATILSIMDKDPMKFQCVNEENFFPLMPLITLPDNSAITDQEIFNWMTEIINSNNYGLRVSVWSKSKSWSIKFAQEIKNSGILRVNSKHLDFSHFLSVNGGVGLSGGPLGEMNYPWIKTSHLQGVSIKYLE